MPSAWVTREWRDPESNRIRREVQEPGLDGVKAGDRYAVEWIDAFRKRHFQRVKRQTGKDAKRTADKLANDLNGKLTTGTYEDRTQTTWTEFRQKYDKQHLSGMKPRSAQVTREALAHFERLVKPAVMNGITAEVIAEFVAKRRRQRGKRKDETISLASVNKELRHIRATLNIAAEWGYLKTVPKVRLLKEPKGLPRYMTPEHFAAIYQACDSARLPKSQAYAPADWWRALLVTAYMTGWRISELLSFLRADLEWNEDRSGADAILRAENTKGGRDERIPLRTIVLDHITRIPGFEPEMFLWPHSFRFLYDHFGDIQRAAGIHLTCRRTHRHTDACHVYGFHDLRRAFATLNADRLTGDALQALMRHKSYATTQGYINVARQLNRAVADLYEPKLPQVAGQG